MIQWQTHMLEGEEKMSPALSLVLPPMEKAPPASEKKTNTNRQIEYKHRTSELRD